MNILIVRLGALGDVVHAIPAAAALRDAFPDGRLDWLVEARHRDIVDLVTVIDRRIVLGSASVRGWTVAAREMRAERYDVAVDLQGLMKSAVLARASGAKRVVGFSIWHLREKTARPFYSATEPAEGGHVIRKNLRLLRAVGIEDQRIRFPLAPVPDSAALDTIRRRVGPDAPFAIVNAGAAWPNKRWPPERYGALAAFLRDACGLTPIVLWGPGEEGLAAAVSAASHDAAVIAPPTSVRDLVAIARAASLVVSGDTGPLHIANAVGTPTVSLFGPTDPERNGPFADADVCVSRFDRCGCHYDRRCHHQPWCMGEMTIDDVCAAVRQRIAAGDRRG